MPLAIRTSFMQSPTIAWGCVRDGVATPYTQHMGTYRLRWRAKIHSLWNAAKEHLVFTDLSTSFCIIWQPKFLLGLWNHRLLLRVTNLEMSFDSRSWWSPAFLASDRLGVSFNSWSWWSPAFLASDKLGYYILQIITFVGVVPAGQV